MNGTSTTTATAGPTDSGLSLSPTNLCSSPPPDGFHHHPQPFSSPAAAGKSGRVIEKLMAENDRLRRELKVETTARDEERKAKEALRQQRDFLQSTNDNLVLQGNIDRASLARKDRKIEELKQQKEAEAKLRETAEGDLRITQRETNEVVQEVKTQLSKEVTERKKAVNEYDVLKESLKRIDATYKSRLDKMKVRIDTLEQQRQKDADLLRKLEVTIEQQQQELEKMRAAKAKITERYSETLKVVEAEMATIRSMTSNREEELVATIDAAKEALGSLRHSLNVNNNFKDM